MNKGTSKFIAFPSDAVWNLHNQPFYFFTPLSLATTHLDYYCLSAHLFESHIPETVMAKEFRSSKPQFSPYSFSPPSGRMEWTLLQVSIYQLLSLN